MNVKDFYLVDLPVLLKFVQILMEVICVRAHLDLSHYWNLLMLFAKVLD